MLETFTNPFPAGTVDVSISALPARNQCCSGETSGSRYRFLTAEYLTGPDATAADAAMAALYAATAIEDLADDGDWEVGYADYPTDLSIVVRRPKSGEAGGSGYLANSSTDFGGGDFRIAITKGKIKVNWPGAFSPVKWRDIDGHTLRITYGFAVYPHSGPSSTFTQYVDLAMTAGLTTKESDWIDAPVPPLNDLYRFLGTVSAFVTRTCIGD